MGHRALWTFLVALLLAGTSLASRPGSVMAANAQQNTGISLTGPSACPPGGCAAGQRLSYRLDFELGVYDATQTQPNVKVCLYVPSNWYEASSVQLDGSGGITGNPYNNVAGTTGCPEDLIPPTNYTLAAAGESAFNNIFVFHDSLGFSFRIARGGTVAGSVLMRVFEYSSGGTWTRTGQVFTPQITPVPPATTLYVAGSPGACTGNPCYLNSSGDFPGGVGSGLKDAVDAADAGARIVILGGVEVKGNAVQVNKALTIEGSGDATLTGSGGCANPLVEFSAGGALRNLNLNDGACTSPNRTLVSVNSPADVLIEGNDLTGGADAIRVVNNTGNLNVRYNHIRGNSGYALWWDTGAPGGALNMVANNVMENRSGDPVECSAGASGVVANRRIDHNYWGATAPASASTHCTINAGKRLGAPIAANSSAPGVTAERITVTTTKTYRFNNQIAVRRSAEGGDFDLYLVNHGAAGPDAVPFTNSLTGSPNPCSDFWDVFLAEGASPGGSLELSFKYNRSSACLAVIESSQFCEQASNASRYPLWWYDPAGSVTAGWDTTGQNPAGSGAAGATGQGTTCSMPNDEITVVVDNSGRPSLANDLNFTPFVVGIAVPATFQTLASNNTVTVRWTTTSEADLSGFYVLRSLAATGPFAPISDLIARKGSALSGGDYGFVDGGRTNGVANYYRLQIVRTDGSYFFSDILSIVPNPATITPTLTPSRTITVRPTNTPFFRLPTPTRFPTLTRRPPTPTRSLLTTPGLTVSPATTGTAQSGGEQGYPGPEGSQPAPGETGYPEPGEGTEEPYPAVTNGTTAPTAASGTPGPSIARTRTNTPTGSLTPQVEGERSASDWISLVLGLVLSGSVVFGLSWFLFLRRKS